MEWVEFNGSIPSEAVYIRDNPNNKIFVVGRTEYNGGIHCDYIDITTKELTISYGGFEINVKDDFEILVGPSDCFYWKRINKNTKLNDNDQIVIGGNEDYGDKLGVARCKYNNNNYFGKTNLEYLYHANFGINNVEIVCYEFEVLVYKEN